MQVKAFSDGDPSILGVFKSFSGPEFEAFLAVAARMSDDYDFAHTSLVSAVGAGVVAPAVTIFKKSEDKVLTYTESLEVDSLREWVDVNAAPLLIDLDE